MQEGFEHTKGIQIGIFLNRPVRCYGSSAASAELDEFTIRQSLAVLMVDWRIRLAGTRGVAVLVTFGLGAGFAAPGKVFWKRMIRNIPSRGLESLRAIQ